MTYIAALLIAGIGPFAAAGLLVAAICRIRTNSPKGDDQ